MPFYEKGPVRIHYEEHGSGVPLLLIAGGGLNSTIAGLTNPFNAIEEFKGEYRCIAADLRNANSGQSSGPLEIERPWDAYTDDHIGVMDHLGIDKFVVMGFCIGGPFIWSLLKRAPNRVVAAVLAQPKVKKLLSSDHFSVDGTLIEAWASMKSVKPKDGSGEPPAQGGGRNAEADFHGQKRSNDTHASTTDPDARLYRKGKGKETKLCFIGHGLMENRHGLLVDACLTLADGHAERVAALHMIEPRADRPTAITLGADKAYDAEDFVNELRSMNVTPHVAQNTSGRSSAIDARTTRHGGYAVSQRIRKRIEEAFGWMKTVAGQEKTKFRGRDRVGWAFIFAAAAYNLVRLPKLIAVPA